MAEPGLDSRILMQEMTTTEVRDAILLGKTTVLIFSASTEASGSHLALGKHIYRAHYLGERIARELGNALLAPIIPFAPVTDEIRFPGSINISSETFSRLNEEVAESMVNAGFKNIILMGDHDGNQQPLKALADRLDERHKPQGVRVFYSSAAYARSNHEIEVYLNRHAFPPSRHAGVADTSSLWAVDARHVRPDKIAVGGPVPPAGAPLALGENAVEGDPRMASQELGKMFMEWKVKNAVAEISGLTQGSIAKEEKER